MIFLYELLDLSKGWPVCGDVRKHAAGLPLPRDVVQRQEIKIRDHSYLHKIHHKSEDAQSELPQRDLSAQASRATSGTLHVHPC